MLTLTSGLKIYVYTRPADMRKGIQGLSGLAEMQALHKDRCRAVRKTRRQKKVL